MKKVSLLVGVLAAGLLAGCASTAPAGDTAAIISAAEASQPRTCSSTSMARMTSQMRQRCAGVRTIDKSFMEQQITPCNGQVCGGRGGS